MNFIYGELDGGSTVVSGLFLDLSKAFDTVDHTLLMNSCYKAGIRGPTHDLLRSYLNGRSQAVSANKILGSFKELKAGVPQGSVLGPTLFLLFFNDINLVRLHGRLNIYCDDSALFYSSSNDAQNCQLMNEDLEQLHNYFKFKKLVLNQNKTKIIHFHSHSKSLNNSVQVTYMDTPIEQVERFDYLGISFDSHLTWKYQCEDICKKIRPAASILFRLKRYLPTHALKQIYFSFVHNHLSYMSSIWGQAAAVHLKPIQVLQNRCLKTVYSLDRLTPSVDLYNHHAKGILPIKGLHLLSTLKFIRQVKNNEIYHTITFPYRSVTRNLRDNSLYLDSRIPQNSFGSRQLTIYGPWCFNKLNATTRSVSITTAFVRAVKDALAEPTMLEKLLKFHPM
jgi:hypothetical protein